MAAQSLHTLTKKAQTCTTHTHTTHTHTHACALANVFTSGKRSRPRGEMASGGRSAPPCPSPLWGIEAAPLVDAVGGTRAPHPSQRVEYLINDQKPRPQKPRLQKPRLQKPRRRAPPRRLLPPSLEVSQEISVTGFFPPLQLVLHHDSLKGRREEAGCPGNR